LFGQSDNAMLDGESFVCRSHLRVFKPKEPKVNRSG
jgi:hypothetical protein